MSSSVQRTLEKLRANRAEQPSATTEPAAPKQRELPVSRNVLWKSEGPIRVRVGKSAHLVESTFVGRSYLSFSCTVAGAKDPQVCVYGAGLDRIGKSVSGMLTACSKTFADGRVEYYFDIEAREASPAPYELKVHSEAGQKSDLPKLFELPIGNGIAVVQPVVEKKVG